MNEFRNGLSFTKRERIGVFTLACLIILIAVILRMIPQASNQLQNDTIADLAIQLDSIFQSNPTKKQASTTQQKKSNKPQRAKRSGLYKSSTRTAEIFIRDSIARINPNKSNHEQLVAIGIPKRVAHTIINFREKGGQFFKSKDLLKIYGMNQEVYAQIESQIDIPAVAMSVNRKFQRNEMETKAKEDMANAPVDINLASEEALQTVFGIGPYFAKKIVARRTGLGGYYTIDQLSEIDRLNDSILLVLKPALSLTPIVEKINMNEASEFELMLHPYISKEQAKLILRHRDFNLKLRSWKELETILKITPNEVERIKQYFHI